MMEDTAVLFGFAYNAGLHWGQTTDDGLRVEIKTKFFGAYTLARGLFPPTSVEQMVEAFTAGQRAGERRRAALIVTRAGSPPHRPARRIKGKRRLIRRRSG